MEKKNLFNIGKMAEFCHTTKDALYFYERKGLLKPAFIDSNGYRYYDTESFYTLDCILSLRAADSTVKEIQEFMSEPSPEKYVRQLTQKLEWIKQKRRALNVLEKRLSDTISLTQEGIACPKEPFFSELPQEYLICKRTEDQNIARYYLSTFSEVLLSCTEYGIPYDFHMSAFVSAKRLHEKCYEADYLYAVSPYPLEGADIMVKPSGRYISCIHTGSYASLSESYEKLFAYINRQKLETEGNSYERTLIGWMNCTDISQYQTMISIKLKE